MIVLHHVDILNTGIKNIVINGQKISAVSDHNTSALDDDTLHLEFEDCIAFPGLINSHDHLDFNLFPALGNYIYNNYTEWGPDIHTQDKETIAAVLKIPKALRTQWGIYKNVINGITTVVQHGEKLNTKNAPITVFNNCHSLHSVALEHGWKYKLNKPFVNSFPFVIHIGEGTDPKAHTEIDQLIKWNFFKRKLIGIHGVAMDSNQAKHFEALIWCPDSNLFLLGKTAAIDKLKTKTTILFGTDATVSASWNIWQQLHKANAMKLLTSLELIDAIAVKAATVWNLKRKGIIAEDYDADIVIAKKKIASTDNVEAFFAINPEDILLVINKGKIILFDASVSKMPKAGYSKVYVNGVEKYIIGNLPELIKNIKHYHPNCNLPVEID
jgi:cytosine/adenosine deaminase-related metal-dependent hydrolase